MSMRRFNGSTSGFSKKFENQCHSVALHYMYYNYCRVHQSLRVTPALEAQLRDHVWSIEELLSRLDSNCTSPSPVRYLESTLQMRDHNVFVLHYGPAVTMILSRTCSRILILKSSP